MKTLTRILLATLLFASAPLSDLAAFPFKSGNLTGAFDTTFTYGHAWRQERRDADLIGKANGGRANTVNGDDGNLNYQKGESAYHVTKLTHDLNLFYGNYAAFFRASYFYDFANRTKPELTDPQQDKAGRDFQMLDAYVRGRYDVNDHMLEVRVGNQVVSWGQSTYIQNGINVINTFDVAKLRIPGSDLKESLLPTPMARVSYEVTRKLNVEAIYLFQFDKVKLDVCGTYFATSDIACQKGDGINTGGFGSAPEGTPSLVVRKTEDREASNSGQYGFNMTYLLSGLNATEIGLYYLNYHSHLPYLTAKSKRTSAVPVNPEVVFDFPEDIHLYGGGFSTSIGGVAFQGEYSHRTNMPIAIDDFEVVSSAQGLGTPFFPYSSQLGIAPIGSEVQGFKRLDVGQWQGTLTKTFGPHNPFFSNDWLLIGEAAATKVYGMPNVKDLRFEGPGTNLPPAPVPGVSGIQTDGWATSFSWGYVLSTEITYNNAIGKVNLVPNMAFSHDVNGVTPSPIGNFVRDRKALTYGLKASYINRLFAEINYTQYYGGGNANLIHDRDFLSITGKVVY